ncbi:family 78 glycoside hydrolase catalytic domain [Bacteroidota bacterium]
MLVCEYMKDPAVVDRLQPRLSWINTALSGARNQEQTAWQIRVSSTKNGLNQPDLWDSEKVSSQESIRISYQGRKLESMQECWWQVRVWDKNDNVSKWSKPSFWRMGLLEKDDWKASWIGAPWQGEEALPKPPGGPDGRPKDYGPPAPLLRKAFKVEKKVVKAVVFTTGLGYFELYLNGEKVGNDELIPNQTNYSRRPQLPRDNIPLPDEFTRYKVMYLAYDITDLLKKGENVLGSILGNGFYNPAKFWTSAYGSPRFIAQLQITYSDGSQEQIISDKSWKVSKSPILMNMVYYGEIYDARKEQAGWHSPGFDDSNWEFATLREPPSGDLVAHTAKTDKVTEIIEPVSIIEEEKGTYLVDFGIEISGRIRLKDFNGPDGSRIDIEYLCNTYSGDHTYICNGEQVDSYASRFNWFVFSSVRIKNWTGELTTGNIQAEAVNTEIETSAVFETSNELFNEINTIWKRSQLDNMHGGIASDCPHRERSGYTGDGQVACVTVMHNFDARNFYYKWISDIHDAQIKSTGYVPNGAPWQAGCGGGVAWGAAITIMPWEFYLHYGDPEILSENYESMKGYIEYMKTWLTEDGTMLSLRAGHDGKPLKWFNLGEWAGTGQMPSDEFVHTFYFWYCKDIVAKTAGFLGLEREAESYSQQALQAKDAFHKKFYNPETGSYGNNGGDILALRMGVPEDRYERVIEALKANIIANKGHLDTGIFGTRFFFEVLAENDLNQLAYEAMNKKTYPSFGYGIENGATTTWEHWDGSSSQNHPMFGGGLVWFYRNLAGMQTDAYSPGYKHIIFNPQPVKGLDFVHYSNMTPYGSANIRWEYNSEALNITVHVPVGCTATLHYPTISGKDIKEGGIALSDNPDVKSFKVYDTKTIIQLGSGEYNFHN